MIHPGSASVFWFRNEQHHQHDRKRELAIINATMSTFIHIQQPQNEKLSSNCAKFTAQKTCKNAFKNSEPLWYTCIPKLNKQTGRSLYFLISSCVSTNMIHPGSASVFWFRNEQHHQHDRKRELAIINATMSTFIHIQQPQNEKLSSNCAKFTAKKLTKTFLKLRTPVVHMHSKAQQANGKNMTFWNWNQSVSAPTWFNLAQQVFFDSGTSSITNFIGRGSSQSSTPNCPHSSTFNKHKMTSYQVLAQRSLKTNLQKHFQKLRTPVVRMHGKAQQASRKVMTFWYQLSSCVSTNMVHSGSASVFWFRNEQHHQHDRKRELSIINAKCPHSTSTKWQCNIPATLRSSFSDQTNAIPHWLWNQPSAPPVHPEDGVKGCLGNAVKVSEPQKMSSCHSQINLPRHYPLKEKSRMLGHLTLGWMFTVSLFLYDQQNIMQLIIDTHYWTVGVSYVQDYATHSVIRQMRYLTGCGISPLHHRFTPKMESKGVSEML